MLNTGIMLLILAILIFLLVRKVEYYPDGNQEFFGINNTKAMRGFWCLIIMLVHVPSAHQNRIQDLMGSFAYIGVTFYFMSSAYGLSLKTRNHAYSIQGFWKSRLPKLLIPQISINLFCAIISFLLFGTAITVPSVITPSQWLRWLIICYLIVWMIHKISKAAKSRIISICLLIAAISLSFYIFNKCGIYKKTIWSTELYGFIWGILLAFFYNQIKNGLVQKWFRSNICSFFLAIILGLIYLKFKYTAFWGDYLLKIILGLSILTFILALNTRFSIGNRFSLFLGEISFEVYLIHGDIFKIVSRLNDDWASGPYILICLVLSIAGAALIHYFSKRIYSLYCSAIYR